MKAEIMCVEERGVFVLGMWVHSRTQGILDVQVYTPVTSALLRGLSAEI